MKFKYSGPASGVTLADGAEVLLWPGHEVELPVSELTEALEDQGYLQRLATEATKPASKKKGD
jgi:hypothetical protein